MKKLIIRLLELLIGFCFFLGFFGCGDIPGPYDAPPPDYRVSRKDLSRIANQWLEGRAPVAKNARQTVNGRETPVTPPESGLNNRVFFCDTRTGQVSAWADKHHYLYQARLAVRRFMITEIEVYAVCGFPRSVADMKSGFVPGKILRQVVERYFDALIEPDLPISFHKDVIRYEMGLPLCVSAWMCNAEHRMFSYVFQDVIDRRYVIDEENGVVVAYIFFELLGGTGGMSAVEAFKIIDGRIHEINAYWDFALGVVDPGWNGGNLITPPPLAETGYNAAESWREGPGAAALASP